MEFIFRCTETTPDSEFHIPPLSVMFIQSLQMPNLSDVVLCLYSSVSVLLVSFKNLKHLLRPGNCKSVY